MFPTRVEIIPTGSIAGTVAAHLPVSTVVTVTCLPSHGIERTMSTSLELSDLGYTVVPHLAARALASAAQLRGILADCRSAGITEVFAISGDGAQPLGPYPSSLVLMKDIAEATSGEMSLGIAGYPEGRPGASGRQLLEELLAKQELASSLVTQMCFAAATINQYAQWLRREGVEIPLWAGVAGSVPRTKLLALAGKIGVGASLRFLSGKGSLARNMLSGDAYAPDAVIGGLSPEAIAGLHLYSFNSLEKLPSLAGR